MDQNIIEIINLEKELLGQDLLQQSYLQLIDRIEKDKKFNICNHPPEDIFLIYAYTSSIGKDFFPKTINNALRNNDIFNALVSKMIDQLDTALRLLPSFDNEIVYRMMPSIYYDYEETTKIIKEFEINLGEIFYVKQFLSTSVISWNNCNIIWEIETATSGSKAKDIRSLTSKVDNGYGEQEVLFHRESQFKIVDIGKKNNIHIIQMKEIVINSKLNLTFDYNLKKI